MQQNCTLINDYYTEKSKSFDCVGSLDQLQKTVHRLLNDVQFQENQIQNSLNDIRQTVKQFRFSKTPNLKNPKKIPGPSFRNNFNTASLPHRWWNRSMPCLPTPEHRMYISGSQDSLNESFQVCYFTPKKKKSVPRISKNQNAGYCIWLSNNSGEVYCFRVIFQSGFLYNSMLLTAVSFISFIIPLINKKKRKL